MYSGEFNVGLCCFKRVSAHSYATSIPMYASPKKKKKKKICQTTSFKKSQLKCHNDWEYGLQKLDPRAMESVTISLIFKKLVQTFEKKKKKKVCC